MRHLKTNKIVNVSASSENANYTASNLLDSNPSKPWKAADNVSSVTITAEVSYGVSDIAVFGTNAISATVTATDPNEISWAEDSWGSSDYFTDAAGNFVKDADGSNILMAEQVDSWANNTITTPTVTAYQRSNSSALWLQLSSTIDRPANLAVILKASEGETAYAGVMRSSIAELYGGRNPRYGLTIGMVDTSISAELSNGSRYYKKRNVLREFDVEILMTNSAAFDVLNFFQQYGAAETAWKITDLDSNEWVVFGYINVDASYDYLNRATVSMKLREVL